jgi:hypothetical protein
MSMTPQERELVTALFDRLATLETNPRDGEAERAIIEGLRRAPNATYALVQTALVQDEALKRADAHIRELEARLGDEPATRPTGFLDGMRDALLGGRRDPARGGSVPSVRPAQAQDQPQAQGQAAMGSRYEAPPAPGAPWRQGPAPGGSFLGTAASAAAGVIGGALLLDGIRSMMGHGGGGLGIADPALGANHGSPWESGAGGDLSRQAGVDDIGRDQHGGGGSGLFDSSAADHGAPDQANQPDQDDVQDVADLDDSGSDFGGGDFGGSDDA